MSHAEVEDVVRLSEVCYRQTDHAYTEKLLATPLV